MPCPAPNPCRISEHTAEAWPVVPKLVKSLEPTTFSLKSWFISQGCQRPWEQNPVIPCSWGCSLYSSSMCLTGRGSGYAGHVLSDTSYLPRGPGPALGSEDWTVKCSGLQPLEG